MVASLTGVTSAEQRNELALLQAELALANGQAQQAWNRIDALPEPTGAAASTYLDARMRIALAAARPVDAVRAEIRTESLTSTTAQRSEVRNRLLALLRQARERGVKLDPAASNDPLVKGWLDLGGLVNGSRGATLSSGAEAARWRARYPQHPATELLGEALPPTIAGDSITHIALLLPGSGAGANQARTIREGLEFALRQLPADARPELRLYDTSTVPVVEQMAAARAGGADFIIGPFLRTDVVTAAATGSQAVPMLALNFLAGDEAAGSGFYQFALSPEDEAREIARRALAKGQKRGVALAPAGDWGNRVLTAFTQEYRAGGGVLLAQAVYDTSQPDYSAAIRSVLGTQDSDERLQRLQRTTGAKYEFEPRRRADIDFIYAAASEENQARLLRPQLNYNFAGAVPIYMSSDSYAADNPDAAQDLSGVEFPDMPWRLPDASLDATRASAAQDAGNNGAWRSSYFAFGYDALQLALAVAANRRDLSRVQVAGLTGQLRLTPTGRVRREQQWARVQGGAAVLTDPLTIRN
jgi:outer membrane PBP1 activator LpoA protein